MSLLSFSFSSLILTGRSEIKAGNKETDKTNDTNTPIATKLPKCLNGGTSEKFMVMKPNAVVTLARKTG